MEILIKKEYGSKTKENNERLRVICVTRHSGEKVFHGHYVFPSYWLSNVQAMCYKRRNDMS